MAKDTKTLEDRIERLYSLAEDHYGEIRSVSIRKHSKIGWLAKIQFDNFDAFTAEGKSAEEAVKSLRKRLKKIINRYQMV